MIGLKMKKNVKLELVGNYLDSLFPNPKCELNYNTDYELLIAVVLSAQATDKSVNSVTPLLFSKYPTLKDLKDAQIDDIISIIHPIGTYNRKAQYILDIAKILYDKYDGKVPNDRKALEAMPGVGRKVANVVLSEWFKEPNIAVDTHVNRVSKRLKIAKESDSLIKTEESLQKFFPKDEWSRRHIQLVLFGRYHCKSQKPDCSNCKLKDICIEKNRLSD